MSTTTARRRAPTQLSFGGIIRSEFIKLFSLRSTIWCFAIILVITIGLGFLLAATFYSPEPLSSEGEQGIWVQVATLGIGFSQLVAAVLGALVITGEYSTGMIRSTLTAVPRRLPALAAKVLVIGITTFVVGLVAVLGAAILPIGLLRSNGVDPNFDDANIWLAFLGGAGYLALLAMLSLAIGAIVRNSAGGIAASLGLILVVPTVLGVVVGITRAEWAQNLGAFLPSAAGGQLYSYASGADLAAPGVVLLEPWQGLLVLVAWVVVLVVIASALIKRRDA